MDVILASLAILCFAWLLGALAARRYRIQKAASRLQVRESLTVLRGPGESLRKRAEDHVEKISLWMLQGVAAVLLLFFLPFLVTELVPNANRKLLLASAIVLSGAGSWWLIQKCVNWLGERNRMRLGWLGECLVAEHLANCCSKGCIVFHDLPMKGPDWAANIDHVVVSPHGVAVVETKMRSKPTDLPRGCVVEFDGERLSWPKYPHDVETLQQVKRNAVWLQDKVRNECGITVPVAQVVAIPEWIVVERKLGQPRVVNAKGVTDAVFQSLGVKDRPPLLSSAQVEEVRLIIDKLCRDVEF